MPTTTKPKPLALRRDKAGWWMSAEHISPDEPWWGPWPTKADAEEARRSYRRNNVHVMQPGDIKSEWRGKRKLPTRNALFTLSPQG